MIPPLLELRKPGKAYEMSGAATTDGMAR